MSSRPLISSNTLPTLDETYSKRLCFYCKQLSVSVENLRGSINRYEYYKENKKTKSMMDPENDDPTRD